MVLFLKDTFSEMNAFLEVVHISYPSISKKTIIFQIEQNTHTTPKKFWEIFLVDRS